MIIYRVQNIIRDTRGTMLCSGFLGWADVSAVMRQSAPSSFYRMIYLVSLCKRQIKELN